MAGISKRKPGELVRCTQCGAWKPWEVGVFRSENGKPRQPCVECDEQRRANYTQTHRDQEREATRKRMARWRAANPDKVHEANRRPRSFDRELAKERVRRWKREHPESASVQYHRRKAKKIGLPNAFTRGDWEECLAYWDHRCCICGRSAGIGYSLAKEHWIPLADNRADNPGTVPWNILPMCHARWGASGGCNNAKWTHDPETWLIRYVGEVQARQKLAEIYEYFRYIAS